MRKDEVIDTSEKSSGTGSSFGCRNSNAMRRSFAGGGGDRAEQGNQIMSGVCGNWVRNFQVYHKN